MAQDTDELRARLDEQRAEISGTVEQIENRIMPGRIMARRRDRVRRTMTDWKDAIFGNDEPQYAWDTFGTSQYAGSQYRGGSGYDGSQEGLVHRAGDAASSAVDSARESLHAAPERMRRQARGNPMAAGAVALGAGWLIGSLMPKTEEEQIMARRLEPALANAASTVKSEGQSIASELQEPAREAMDRVKQTGQEAASELKDDAREAASTVRSNASERSDA